MKCRLCNSNNISKELGIQNTLIDGVYSNKKAEYSNFTILKCENCGLYQLKEIIDYDKIYSNYKFTSNSIETISDWMKRLHEIFVDNYDIQNKKILEIGASDGCFLNLFKENNSIYGIEPSSILTENAKIKYGINIKKGYFDKKSFPNKKFDFIICRHVIEHIENLEQFIIDITNNINNNGLIYIEVPDMDYILKNLNYTNFFHEHINYFSRSTLKKIMKALGFDSIFEINNKVHNGSFGIIFEKKINNSVISLENKINEDKKIMSNILKKYKNISGYGAANKTFKLLSIFNLDNKIDTIYDNNKNLWGNTIVSKKDINIKSPKEIDDNIDVIIIFATSYTDEIIKFLQKEIKFKGDIIIIYPKIKVIKYTNENKIKQHP